MAGDKLLIAFEGLSLALDTALVAGIVEMERVPFMPGQTGFVSGMISFRNEPVAVVDLMKAFNAGGKRPCNAPRKIAVVKEKGKLLGLDTCGAAVSFLWGESVNETPSEMRYKFIKSFIGYEGGSAGVIDTAEILGETSRILSAETPGGKENLDRG